MHKKGDKETLSSRMKKSKLKKDWYARNGTGHRQGFLNPNFRGAGYCAVDVLDYDDINDYCMSNNLLHWREINWVAFKMYLKEQYNKYRVHWLQMGESAEIENKQNYISSHS